MTEPEIHKATLDAKLSFAQAEIRRLKKEVRELNKDREYLAIIINAYKEERIGNIQISSARNVSVEDVSDKLNIDIKTTDKPKTPEQ